MMCPKCGQGMIKVNDRGVYTCNSCRVSVHDGVYRPTVEKVSDDVNHPRHYAEGRVYEPIDVIEDWELGYNLGNVVKYISRAGRKDDIVQDLEKAEFYLKREIENLKKKNGI